MQNRNAGRMFRLILGQCGAFNKAVGQKTEREIQFEPEVVQRPQGTKAARMT